MLDQSLLQWLEEHHCDGVNLNVAELLQYQNKTSLIDLAPRRTVQAKLAGSYLTRTKGRGMEFDEARHYQPGDDIRAIDWRVTARTGKTHTKLFREEKERPVFVVADLSQSMRFGTQLLFKSVQCAHLSALIAWAAQKRGDRIGGIIFNQHQHKEFKPQTRHRAVLALCHGLLALHGDDSDKEPTSSTSLADALARTRRLAKPGSTVYVLSDFSQLDNICVQHLTQLSRHCEVVAFSISDPFEHQLPDVATPQSVLVTDGRNDQRIVLGDKQQSDDYARQHSQHFENIAHQLRLANVRVLPICAGKPLADQVQFGKKGKR
ncbi:DUF58 domain-containing protein [Aestuariibacter salexigens]|uniref:DUF58 domain-containing protein n=1 Tax=Aestuariibacter salexigens TaxID=226010 RepID=UPI0004203916|nr:DUF58 domain-containing protein [Aestuariibacter salexigens]